MYKQLVLLTFVSFFSATALISQSDTVRVASSIDSVRIYFQGARVERSARVNLKAGEFTLALVGLPARMNSDHIEVSVGDNAEILAFKHRVGVNKPQDLSTASEEWIQIRQKLEYRTKEVLNQKQVFEVEEQLLMNNMKIGGSERGADAASIGAAADLFRTRLNEIRRGKLKLDARLDAIRDSIATVNKKLNVVKSQLEAPQGEVWIRILAKNTGTIHLGLSYFVEAAGWEPTYDFRVREISDPLEMTYRAKTYQSTGEDWNRVPLIFTSGYPSMSGEVPEMEPWYINRPQPFPDRRTPRGQGSLMGTVTDASTGEPLPFVNVTLRVGDDIRYGTPTDAEGRYAFKPVDAGRYDLRAESVGYENFFRSLSIGANQNEVVDVQMTVGQIMLEEMAVADRGSRREKSYVRTESISGVMVSPSDAKPVMALTPNQITFRPGMPLTVLSDGRDTPIELKTAYVEANYFYRTVPKYDDAVYLLAQLPNLDRNDLLSGTSYIYYQGAYAGEAYVDVANTADTLELSLGRDRNIAVKREGIKELNDRKIFGDRVRESVGWKLTVRNNKGVPIRLELADQYPLSEIKSIEVNRGSADGAKVEDETGKIVWTLELPAHTSETVSFSYTLKYPVGTMVYGR